VSIIVYNTSIKPCQHICIFLCNQFFIQRNDHEGGNCFFLIQSLFFTNIVAIQFRTRSLQRPSQFGGGACSAELTEERPCHPPTGCGLAPIDCRRDFKCDNGKWCLDTSDASRLRCAATTSAHRKTQSHGVCLQDVASTRR